MHLSVKNVWFASEIHRWRWWWICVLACHWAFRIKCLEFWFEWCSVRTRTIHKLCCSKILRSTKFYRILFSLFLHTQTHTHARVSKHSSWIKHKSSRIAVDRFDSRQSYPFVGSMKVRQGNVILIWIANALINHFDYSHHTRPTVILYEIFYWSATHFLWNVWIFFFFSLLFFDKSR